MSRFIVTVAAIVCGLFLFIALTQVLAFKDPLHITLDNGSTANYYDPSRADHDADVARAFAAADAQAAARKAAAAAAP